MKALLKILLFALILNSCGKKKEGFVKSKIYSVDFEKYRDEDRLKIIDLDSIANYGQLISEMERITCDDKVSGLRINSKTTDYFITGFASCPTSGLVSCYFRVINIGILNDSIMDSWSKSDETIPIENLKIELDSLMSNSYNLQYGGQILKPAIIWLHMDDEVSISKTKKVLVEIAEQFQRIRNDKGPEYFQYQILFENTDFFPIKPPPLAPKPWPIQVED